MPVLSNAYYIPPDHEQWLVFHLERVKNDCFSCARAVLDKTSLQITVTRIAQFVVLVLLQHVFGYSPSALHITLRAPSFSKVRSWIAGLDGSYPGESTGYKRYAAIIEHVGSEINRIAADMQDAIQRDVGKAAREKFTAILDARRVHMDYHERWGIENGFRDVKERFLAKGRSRQPCMRQFRLVLGIMLYNRWEVKRKRVDRATSFHHSINKKGLDESRTWIRRKHEQECHCLPTAVGFLVNSWRDGILSLLKNNLG